MHRGAKTRYGTVGGIQPVALPAEAARGVDAPRGLRLEGAVIDTRRAEKLTLAAQPRTTRDTLPLLIQCVRPLDTAGRAALAAAGCVICGYVPENGYLIEAPAARLDDVRAVPAVFWVGAYQPAYKISRGIAAARARYAWQAAHMQGTNDMLAGKALPKEVQPLAPPALEEYVTLTINLFNADDMNSVLARLAGLGGSEIGGAVYASALGRSARIRATMPFASLDAVAALPEVQWIEQYHKMRTFNNVAVQPHLMNVTPVWETNWLGLTGRGQIVAHADTGLDTGNTGTLHPDFTNRVRAAFGWGRDNVWNDPDGHGTHSAGSLCGNGSAFSNGLFKAPAYEAQLVHQSLYYDENFTIVVPTNLQPLFEQAYETNARIHSCSWGYFDNGAYDSMSRDVDAFTWTHPDMLIVFAAGNDGADGNGDGVVDDGGIATPASAKNALSVGASESARPAGSGGYSSFPYGTGDWEPLFLANPIHDDLISTSADGIHQGMFALSSRGPCADGRIKPDIVAPGTDIISCRSRVSGASTLWGTNNADYVFSGGTSMSTPLTASAAALLRQYFAERHSTIISNPSAALLKAVLLNGARSLAPGQYGYEQYREIPLPPRPNVVEGWGQVNLAGALSNLTVWDAQPMTSGATNVYAVTLTETNTLSVLLAWTDYPGTLGAAQALVNDLDVLVIGPDGTPHYPNGLAGPDKTNNVEGLDLVSMPPGVCTVQVCGVVNMGTTQEYALVVRGAAPATAVQTVESTDYQPRAVRPADAPVISAVVTTNASGLAAVTLYYRADSGTWQSVAMAVRTPFELGAVYTNTIPQQPQYTLVEFYVTASAQDSALSISATNSYTVGDFTVYVWSGGSQTAPYNTWATGFKTIYDAMTSSFVLDTYTIKVTNGWYSARAGGDDDGIVMNKAVHLLGVNGADVTIIDGGYNGRVLTMVNAGAVVEGFTIQRGWAQGVIEAGGIYMEAGVLRRCTVRDNYVYHLTSNGGGIWMSGGLVDACLIRNNHSWGSWEGSAGGAAVRNNGIVRNCVFVNNEALSSWDAYGGNVGLFMGGVMSNCTAAGGTASGNNGGGVYINFTGTVHNSIVYHNNNGNYAHYSNNNSLLARWGYSCTTPQPSGTGISVVSNITSNPQLVNYTGYDCHLKPESPCRNAGQWQAWMTNAIDADGHARVNESAVDMGGLEFGPLAVSFTATPLNGLTPLRVLFTSYTSGAFTNTVNYYWDFNADGSNELHGTAWARPTNVYDEGWHSVALVASNDMGESATWLRDYYIYAYDTNIHYVAHGGAHVWPFTSLAEAATNIQSAMDACMSGHSVVISDGVYRSSYTPEVPNGVTLRGMSGRERTILDGRGSMRCLMLNYGAVAEDLTLSNGSYAIGGKGGGGVYFYGGGTLRRAHITSCRSIWGAGVYFDDGGAIEDSVIEGNAATDTGMGGGVYINYRGTLNRCIIRNNSADYYGGGISFTRPGGEVRNSVIAGNTASAYGGGAFLGNQAGGTFENCTVVSNVCSTASEGGGIYGWSCTLAIRNSIIYHNRAGTSQNNLDMQSVTMTFENLCTTPPFGTQCLSNDPRLVNLKTGDYRLRGDSYCVNAAKSLSWMSGAFDVEGNARVCNGAPDIGAYELDTNAPLLRVQASASEPHQLGTLEFGSVWLDTTMNKTLYARNVGGSALSGSVAVADGPFWCASATNFTLGVNGNSTLTFSFSPPSDITYSATAYFSGGGGASVLLRGTGGIPEPAWSALLGLITLAMWRARRGQ